MGQFSMEKPVLPGSVLSGNQQRDDHASYIGSWLKVLADDKRAIFQAAAHAQRAVAFLHGLQPPVAQPLQAA